MHVIADTGIIFGAFYALEQREEDEVRGVGERPITWGGGGGGRWGAGGKQGVGG